MIYLDNNATTRLAPEALEAMLPFLAEQYGNPSSAHRFGQQSRQAIEHARHQVAGLLGCEVRELIFTSGGTESDNAAIHGVLAARGAPGAGGRRHIVTSAVEHSAVREPLAQLAKSGYTVHTIPVTRAGALEMEQLERTLAAHAAEIALATFIWANNETGVLFDVAEIGAACRRHGIPLHVDAVQAAGKIAMAVRDLPVDLMSVSGHKFHGAKGVGALYVRRGVRWQPWQRGGPQERDRRGGTENVAALVAMGKAAELAREALADPAMEARVAALRDRLEGELLARVPESAVIGDVGHRLPNTTNIGFAGLEAEAILLLLSEQEICASAGAACASGSLEPSPVLRAMGVDERFAHGAIRFSMSRYTTAEEIEETLARVPPIIQQLRQTLPV